MPFILETVYKHLVPTGPGGGDNVSADQSAAKPAHSKKLSRSLECGGLDAAFVFGGSTPQG